VSQNFTLVVGSLWLTQIISIDGRDIFTVGIANNEQNVLI